MRPGQWVLLILGVLLGNLGITLLLGALFRALIPDPDEWRLTEHREGSDWVVQQATEAWEWLQDLIPTLLIVGTIALLLGVAGVLLGAAGLGRDIDPLRAAAAPGASSTPSTPTAPTPAADYPVRLIGSLDAPPSRALWLVKWLLTIPHYLVLALLWSALITITVAAGLVILFTGRYPRAWFCFNVGVLRWSWRVGFYGYAALATDRYPPFTLASADYPADLSIAYPQRLSHGMVLVKSWLLAIPHLLLIGIFTSPSGSGWQGSWDDAGNTTGGGGGFSLLGLLLLITAIILLFTRRYPTGIFDFVMGLNRWVNRVGAYVLLMRDEYPPFRLDQGPEEPGRSPLPDSDPSRDRPGARPAPWSDWV
ncbi:MULTISPECIES: DUF4389 domain-containing protein [unclassified Nesterenkonia]|uniref:DUF4389 domain-containing protein n=1 Tax=unclassified Nesterenkonia TaxID=2629769 RepID=UPI0021048104|nr:MULTISPECIES: DUF4389 domain-containing protein [unclassified Nesterenkonia]